MKIKTHWKKAQKRAERYAQKQKTTPLVLLEDTSAVLVTQENGWMIITPEQSLQAKTPYGVKLLLEELELPVRGWNGYGK